MRFKPHAAGLVLSTALALGGSALAQAPGAATAGGPSPDDFEAGALDLADELPHEAPVADRSRRAWRGHLEAALGAGRPRDGGSIDTDQRLSLDLRYDAAWSESWRAVFANRLDLRWPAQRQDDNAVNTLKEAYLAWQPAQHVLLDLGRVNARYGAATGYNPTDYFRAGALRAVVSIDPASLKENRQGSAMLRGQWLWPGGSLSLLYSPKLDARADADGLSLDWGATNAAHRGLIALGQRLGATLNAQLLAYREESRPAQLGLNLTGLLGDATVAYLEWSGGRSATLLDQALQRDAGQAWRNRLAVGLTHTTRNELSLTAEYQYNGGGLDRDDWRALQAGPPPAYGAYRERAFLAQDPPTRQGLFLHAVWRDVGIDRLDLGAMLNADLVDSSRRAWLELRYRGERVDYTLQWQHNHGERLSHYGVVPESSRLQLAARGYF